MWEVSTSLHKFNGRLEGVRKRSLQSIHLNAKIKQQKFKGGLFLKRIFNRFLSSMLYLR